MGIAIYRHLQEPQHVY